MSTVGGKWDCKVATPMGDQAFVLTVTPAGDRFTGEARGSIGAMQVDGTVDGDTLAWTMAVPKPMPVTLTCRATVTGDTLDGKVKAGIFGSYAISGTRTGD